MHSYVMPLSILYNLLIYIFILFLFKKYILNKIILLYEEKEYLFKETGYLFDLIVIRSLSISELFKCTFSYTLCSSDK